MNRSLLIPLVAAVFGPTLARAQSTLNASHDLVRLGIASTNLIPNQPTLDAVPLLASALNYATANGVTLLQVDRGAYYFLSAQNSYFHLNIPSLNGITVDFQGSDLILSQPAVGGIWLASSTNAVLENFTLDYAKLPFTQLTVTSVDPAARQIGYTPMPNWPDATTFNQTSVATAGGGFYFFVFRSGHPAPDLSRMPTAPPFTSTQIPVTNTNQPWTTSAFLARIRPGDTLVLTARGGGDPVHVNGCNGCTMRNITIYSASGWGFQVLDSQNTVVDHVYTIPKPGTDRLISTNADGLTLAQPGPNNTYRLNRAIRTLDDGLSPHSLLLGTVLSQTAQQVQLTRQYNLAVTNGSPVTFESAADGTILGTATIVAQTPPAPVNSGETVTINFDRDLPTNLAGAVVYTTDPNQRGTNTILERNTVQDQVFARGISVWGLMNSTLRGNYVFRSAWDAILATHRMVPLDWMSPPLANVTFSQNTIDTAVSVVPWTNRLAAITIEGSGNPNFHVLTGSPNSNVQITGNVIANPGVAAVLVESTSAATVTGNSLVSPNAAPCTNGQLFNTSVNCGSTSSQAVVTTNSPAASISANTVDSSSIAAYVSDLSFTRLAAFAPGSTVRVNGYNIGAGSQPAITLTDADARTWNLAVVASATHSVDVSLPSGVGLGGASVAVTAGGSRYAATLFIDSVDNVAAVNGCAYWVGPTTTEVPAGGGTAEALVVTQAGCVFQTAALSPFATLSGGATGTAVVDIHVAANTGLPRTVAFEIAGYQIPLAQAGVVLSVTKTHTGNFTQGQNGAAYTVTVSNQTGASPTSGMVVVTENLPSGLTLVSASGAGWSCSASTCQRNDPLAGGASYPPLTVTVNVAANAPAQVTNQVSVTGGGSVPAAASDPTAIASLSPVITSVFNAAGYQAGVYSGAFVSIQGSNLTPVADDWSHSIVNGQLPQQLDGVSVTIGGKTAYISQMIPAQINVQAPDLPAGSALVVVTTPLGASAPFTVNVQPYGPAFWSWPNNQPVATHLDYSIAAKNGSFAGVTTVPAQPGEILTLWGTGFGPTNPPVPAGQLPGASAGAQTQNPVTVKLNGAALTVLGAALSPYPGDYQVAIQIPATLADGDYPLVATINGISSPAMTLTVKH